MFHINRILYPCKLIDPGLQSDKWTNGYPHYHDYHNYSEMCSWQSPWTTMKVQVTYLNRMETYFPRWRGWLPWCVVWAVCDNDYQMHGIWHDVIKAECPNIVRQCITYCQQNRYYLIVCTILFSQLLEQLQASLMSLTLQNLEHVWASNPTLDCFWNNQIGLRFFSWTISNRREWTWWKWATWTDEVSTA